MIRVLCLLFAAVIICGCESRDVHPEPDSEPESQTAPTPTVPEPAPDGDWRPLWDGKTLAGWSAIGSGHWAINKGVLIGTHRSEDRQFGHLVSDTVMTDFLMRARFKVVKGNSGLYFRTVIDEEKGISGLQVEMSDEYPTGGLWETNGRGWVVMPTPEQVDTWFKPGEWNEVIVRADDKDVAVWTNGLQSAVFRDDDPRFAGWQKGHVAIQLHANEDMEIRFAAIDIAPVPNQSKSYVE